ncbi:unnamed protein product [Arctia plantaginis]|uniref:Uncharacterized protein n=1 Tax=Arctia plantaginis TaxID=874455 RepID=A0A8S0Z6S5_ARCPL|nr:unnamed protein product [Arctia plantaginis]
MSRNIDDKSTDNEPPKNVLPPDIYTNIHPKVEAAQIPLGGIKLEEREVLDLHEQLVYYHMKPPPVPTPAYPITICCSPKCLRFELINEPVLAKVGAVDYGAISRDLVLVGGPTLVIDFGYLQDSTQMYTSEQYHV